MAEARTWGIVGGGILGMTLAKRLSELGEQVTIIEAADKPGGLTSSWELDGFSWDRFYHVILMSDLSTRKLISELGLTEKMHWVETKTGFYSGGKLYSMSNMIEFFKFPPLSLLDKFRLGLTIFAASKITNWKKLEKISVSDWLIRWSGKNVFNNIWLPLLKAKLGDNYTQTSAAFIWSTIQRMYAARKSGLKKEMFGYMNGGYEHFNTVFAENLLGSGVKFKLNSAVKNIKKTVEGDFEVETTLNTTSRFTHIISTLLPHQSASIVSDLTQDEKNKHQNIKIMGIICPSVILRKPISPYYVTNITDAGIPFTGIIEMSALVDKEAEFNGKNLVYLPKYVAATDKLYTTSDEELKDLFLNALLKMYPYITRDDVLHFAVSRAANVFALPVLNYSELVPGVKTSIENLFIVNSAQIINGTLNVNETIKIAETKLTEILYTLGN